MTSTGSAQQNDGRITELERIAADQERVIGELSGQIAAQWEVIESLRKRLEQLVGRFAELEEMASPEVPITRPPHW